MTEEYFQVLKGKRKQLRNACQRLSFYESLPGAEAGYDNTSVINSQKALVQKLQKEFNEL